MSPTTIGLDISGVLVQLWMTLSALTEELLEGYSGEQLVKFADHFELDVGNTRQKGNMRLR